MQILKHTRTFIPRYINGCILPKQFVLSSSNFLLYDPPCVYTPFAIWSPICISSYVSIYNLFTRVKGPLFCYIVNDTRSSSWYNWPSWCIPCISHPLYLKPCPDSIVTENNKGPQYVDLSWTRAVGIPLINRPALKSNRVLSGMLNSSVGMED